MAKVWTLGYEGRDAATVVGLLEEHRIDTLVDVRERPSSRKAGLSKTPLSDMLTGHGIAYSHRPDLGVPPEVRNPYKRSGEWAPLAAWYEDHLDEKSSAVDALAELAAAQRIALLCYERDAKRCHRSLLAARLAKPGMEPIHI